MLDEQTGLVGGDKRTSKSTYDKGIWGNAKPVESKALYNDKGGASRFFYCAKASKSERNMGCEEMEDKKTDDGREVVSDRPHQRGATDRKNNHPTVKPIKLIQYLVRLVTPKGGVCLDPFLGSGTTAIACIKEGMNYIGIEREEDYVKIANARIKAYSQNKTQPKSI